jgi:hypothetical protein
MAGSAAELLTISISSPPHGLLFTSFNGHGEPAQHLNALASTCLYLEAT